MPRASEARLRPPSGPRAAQASQGGDAGLSLAVVGSSLEGAQRLPSRSSAGSADSLNSLPRAKPTEVYAAAVADLQDADSKSLVKLQQLRSVSGSPAPPSPARRRASSAYAPGALPALPPSPTTLSLLSRASRVSEQPASILERRTPEGPNSSDSGGGVFSPQTASRRPINSAPDSQAYQLMQGGTVTDVWRPALQEPPLRTVPLLAPRPESAGLFSAAQQHSVPIPPHTHTAHNNPTPSKHNVDTTSSPGRTDASPSPSPNPTAPAPAVAAYVHSVGSPPAAAASPPAPAPATALFSSPRSTESPTPHSIGAAAAAGATGKSHRRVTSPLSSGGQPPPQQPPLQPRRSSGAPDMQPGTQPGTPTGRGDWPGSSTGGGGSGSLFPSPPAPPTEAMARIPSPPLRMHRRSVMTAGNGDRDSRQGSPSPQPELQGPLQGPIPPTSNHITVNGDSTSNGNSALTTPNGSGRLQSPVVNQMQTALGSNGGANGVSFGGSGAPGGGWDGGGGGGGGNAAGVAGVSPASRPASGRGRAVQILMDAVRSRDPGRFREAMEYLKLPNGSVAGLTDRHTVTGRTPLHEAVMLNNVAVVRALLTAGADPHVGHMSQGPPLLHAAAWGESAMVSLLLEAGADVHARDIAGYTALHYACAGGHTDTARVLVQHGADPSAVTNEGDTPANLGASHPALLRSVFGDLTHQATHDPTASTTQPTGASLQQQQGSNGPVMQNQNQNQSGRTSPGLDYDITLSPANSAQLIAEVTAAGAAAAAEVAAGPAPSPLSGAARAVGARSLVPAPPGSAGSAGVTPKNRSLRIRMLAAEDTPGTASASEGQRTTTPTPVSASAGRGSSPAVPSPALSDPETAMASPPPELKLPKGVRRQLSKGANLQDIIHAFEDEDQEYITRYSSTGEGPLFPLPGIPEDTTTPTHTHAHAHINKDSESLLSAFHERRGSALGAATPAAPPPPPPALQILSRPSATLSAAPSPGALPSQRSGAAGGNVAAIFLNRTGSMTQGAGMNSGATTPSGASTPRSQLSGLAAVVPITPRFRFGCDIQKNPPLQHAPSSASSRPHTPHTPQQAPTPVTPPAAAAATPQQHPFYLRSATTPGQVTDTPEETERVTIDGSDGQPLQHRYTAPVPATDASLAQEMTFVVRDGGAGGGGDGVDRPSGGVGKDELPPPVLSEHSPPHSPLNNSMRRRVGGGGGTGGGADGGPMSLVQAALPPPTLTASHSGTPATRPSGDAAAAAAVAGGGKRRSVPGTSTAGAHSAKSGELLQSVRSSGTDRVAQAAEALRAQLSGTRHTSQEALQLRAQAMFNRSVELQTGTVAWTRGELLGQGSCGRVYAGLNQLTGALMAVKVMELLTRHNGLREAVEAQLKELMQELDLYKKLSHTHVVAYIDHYYDSRCSTLYIFLEYVPGGSIASMLDRFGRFSEELVRNYTRQLLLGLQYLHAQRVVHRDVKGGNVLVSRDGVVKLADFGASRALGNDTITDGMRSIKGSVFWMAPEVIKGTGYNYKADIWSLGCTVIEMMTGKHPWPQLDNPLTAMFQIARHEDGPPRPAFASPMARDFIDMCLKYDPQERPSADELLKHPFVATDRVHPKWADLKGMATQ